MFYNREILEHTELLGTPINKTEVTKASQRLVVRQKAISI